MCVLVIGMAGSGKTTFIHQIEKQASKIEGDKFPFLVNLDPAVGNVPYTPVIDIRNKIKVKDVMKNYNLGPNGAILTSLNLFSAQFDQVIDKMEAKKSDTEIFVVDTPGQIEVFSWSASGTIISQMLSTSFPSALVYVVDLARCQNPNTFMSNMLFCCSILYKMRLPMVVVFNKSDVASPEPIKRWLEDYSNLSDDLKTKDTYLSSLTRSLALSLDEFYSGINAVYLSSVTGEGFPDFFKALEKAREEYYNVFLPDLEQRMQGNGVEKKRIQEEMEKFKAQVEKDKQVMDLKKNKDLIENNSGYQSIFQKEKQAKGDDKETKIQEVKEKLEKMKIEDDQ